MNEDLERNTNKPQEGMQNTPVNSNESEEEINKKIENQVNKLENNIVGLGDDIKEFETQEKLEEALNKNPSLARRIIQRAEIISLGFVMFNSALGISLPQELHAGDIKGLAITLFKIALSSAALSVAVQGYKKLIYQNSFKDLT